jgi:hypothetical protein
MKEKTLVINFAAICGECCCWARNDLVILCKYVILFEIYGIIKRGKTAHIISILLSWE